MQRHFDEKIQELLEKLMVMGSLAESMVQAALRTLIERDETLCQEVHRREMEVNELQIEVDDRAVKLTALQQPVGTDVRFLFMASRIASELERIGDQAVNICQNAHHILEAPPLKPIVDLPMMGDIAERIGFRGENKNVHIGVGLRQRFTRKKSGKLGGFHILFQIFLFVSVADDQELKICSARFQEAFFQVRQQPDIFSALKRPQNPNLMRLSSTVRLAGENSSESTPLGIKKEALPEPSPSRSTSS